MGRHGGQTFAARKAADGANAIAAVELFQDAIDAGGRRRHEQNALAARYGLGRDLRGRSRFSRSGMALNETNVRRLKGADDCVALGLVEAIVGAHGSGWPKRGEFVNLSVK